MKNTFNSPMGRWYFRWTKRTADVLLALILLLTVFPVAYFIVAIVIKVTDHGPVLTTERARTLNLSTLHHRQYQLLRFRLPQNAFVRTTHIDRWPRLINILTGAASFASPQRNPAEVYHYLSTWLPFKGTVSFIR